MFQQQQSQRKTHIMTPAIASQNEAQAKEKLSGYVYEYLVHVGAPKAAEVFKNELLSQQHITQITPGDFPGFLHNWWCVFWDLYSAAPERRNKYDPSQEAKAFHEYGFIPPSTYGNGPLINGVHPNPQFNNGGGPQLNSMGMPFNSDGIISNYFGSRSGNQPVSSSVQSNQASPIAGTRYLGNHSNTVGARSGAPTPSNILNSGGNTVPSNFSSGSQNAHIFINDQQVRNISQRINTNPARIPFSINHHDGINTPTSYSGNNGSNNGSGFNGMQLGNGTNNDNSNPSVSGIGGQLQNILNGGDSVALVEMKQSPISHMNGNTPINNPNSIQQQGIGGPASVHGVHPDSASVQSQSSSSLVVAGPSSQPHAESTQSANIDFQQNNVRSATGSGEVEEMEISKIKASLIEDYGPGNYGV